MEKRLPLLGLSLMALFACVSPAFGQTRPPRVINESVRGRIAPGDGVLTLGFVVIGDPWVSVTLLVRAVGPSLTPFGISDPATNPTITLYDGDGKVVRSGSCWNNDPSVITAEAQVGAFPLGIGNQDAAFVISLTPGRYTMQITDPSSSGKQVLGEVYLVGWNGGMATLGNMSARSGYPTIIGFVFDGIGTSSALIRAAGPALTAFGLSNVVSDPTLTVYDNHGAAMISNDNWGASGSVLAWASNRVGAFPFASGSKDSAALIALSLTGEKSITAVAAAKDSSEQDGKHVELTELYVPVPPATN